MTLVGSRFVARHEKVDSSAFLLLRSLVWASCPPKRPMGTSVRIETGLEWKRTSRRSCVNITRMKRSIYVFPNKSLTANPGATPNQARTRRSPERACNSITPSTWTVAFAAEIIPRFRTRKQNSEQRRRCEQRYFKTRERDGEYLRIYFIIFL